MCNQSEIHTIQFTFMEWIRNRVVAQYTSIVQPGLNKINIQFANTARVSSKLCQYLQKESKRKRKNYRVVCKAIECVSECMAHNVRTHAACGFLYICSRQFERYCITLLWRYTVSNKCVYTSLSHSISPTHSHSFF